MAESAEENKEVAEPSVDAQPAPSVHTETETVPAEAVTPSHQQPDSEVQIEAAKTEVRIYFSPFIHFNHHR